MDTTESQKVASEAKLVRASCTTSFTASSCITSNPASYMFHTFHPHIFSSQVTAETSVELYHMPMDMFLRHASPRLLK